MVSHHLLQSKLTIRIVPENQIQHPMTNLVFWPMRKSINFLLDLKESLFIRRDQPSLDRNIIGEAIEIKSLLEIYMFLIVATLLFLMDGIFVIGSSISVSTPLFIIMVPFNLFSSWSWHWILSLPRVVLLQLLSLILNH